MNRTVANLLGVLFVRLIAVILTAEVVFALMAAYMYGFFPPYFGAERPLSDRILVSTALLAAAASCGVAALGLFNGWHAEMRPASVWWRRSLIVAAGFNLAVVALQVRYFAKEDWPPSETVWSVAPLLALGAIVAALLFLALGRRRQAKV